MARDREVAPRVRQHVEKLREAGLNTEAFFNALIGIRDDPILPEAHRNALYKLIAMECYVWYLEAIRGEPVDRLKLMDEARKIAEENEAAIKRRRPGDASAELVTRDIGARGRSKKTSPQDAAAVHELGPKEATKTRERGGEHRPAAARTRSPKKKPRG